MSVNIPVVDLFTLLADGTFHSALVFSSHKEDATAFGANALSVPLDIEARLFENKKERFGFIVRTYLTRKAESENRKLVVRIANLLEVFKL